MKVGLVCVCIVVAKKLSVRVLVFLAASNELPVPAVWHGAKCPVVSARDFANFSS